MRKKKFEELISLRNRFDCTRWFFSVADATTMPIAIKVSFEAGNRATPLSYGQSQCPTLPSSAVQSGDCYFRFAISYDGATSSSGGRITTESGAPDLSPARRFAGRYCSLYV